MRVLFFLFLAVSSANADIGLIRKNDTVAVVYRRGNQVVFQNCAEKLQPPITRACAPRGQAFTMDLGAYAANVNRVYKVSSRFNTPRALVQISQRIESVQRNLAGDMLTPGEREGAGRLLATLKSAQNGLLKAKTEILENLESGHDVTYDANYQLAFQDTFDAFRFLWYDDIGLVWTLGSDGTIADEKMSVICAPPWRPANPADFRPVLDGDSVQVRLGRSGIIADGMRVWGYRTVWIWIGTDRQDGVGDLWKNPHSVNPLLCVR